MIDNMARWDDLDTISWIFQVNIPDDKAIIKLYVDVADKIVEEMLLSALQNALHVLVDFMFRLLSFAVWILCVCHQKETYFILLVDKYWK